MSNFTNAVSETVSIGEGLSVVVNANPTLTETFGFTESLTVDVRFFAAVQAKRKVVLIFSVPMLVDSTFTDPTSYTITDLNGNAIPVASVAPLSGGLRATLNLGADLTPGGYYSILVSASVHTAAGNSLSPRTDLFQWNATAPSTTGPIVIPFSSFSGEVTTGLLGRPAGQVFFSPALLQAAGNSVLQVDEVSLCTRAFDEYNFPQPVDPPALFTFSPKAPFGVLGASTSLWSSAERQGIARVELADRRADTLPLTVDGTCNATLVEPIDITKASFLNDARWKLFPGTSNFKTASNLASIGPGPTVVINLEP